ncbi:MAG: DUF697 domain-containing protein [Gloeomargaritaceae cyanobacterium C42_A2020_066]|nr:DUF697 domain-containing protein [Gloeomargaritaceae cyanobacterium C42_A2020_066]
MGLLRGLLLLLGLGHLARLPRPMLLVAGLVVVLGLGVWLVVALTGFYRQVLMTAGPWLANALLVGFLSVGLGLGAALLYTTVGKRIRPQRRASARPPQSRTEAARVSLEAAKAQVARIQDEVTRQALQAQAEAIAAQFHLKALRIALFGTGSVGKTSLINALVGHLVGDVGATLGTTPAGRVYQFRLPGLERQVDLIDTPGILEAGWVGTDREQAAQDWAREADLLLFVVDNDLRRSEYEALHTLVRVGKRTLLVFNKADLYPTADRAALVAQLQSRVLDLLPAADIISVSADPAPVTLADGSLFNPSPQIESLLHRLAEVLREAGEDLVAANLLLQAQRLGTQARTLLEAQQTRQAEEVVERFQWVSAGVIWVTPLPVVDLLGTAAVNTQMVLELGKIYGCTLTLDQARELALSLAKTLAGLGLIRTVVTLVTNLLKLSLGGFVITTAVQSVSAAYLTRIAGLSFMAYFRQQQDWGEQGMAGVVQEQFQRNQQGDFLKQLITDVLSRFGTPKPPT